MHLKLKQGTQQMHLYAVQLKVLCKGDEKPQESRISCFIVGDNPNGYGVIDTAKAALSVPCAYKLGESEIISIEGLHSVEYQGLAFIDIGSLTAEPTALKEVR